MKTFKILLVISTFASVVFFSESATIFKLPDGNLLNRIQQSKDDAKSLGRAGKPTVIEEFNRVNPDGTTETKLSLSNGETQCKKISVKVVNGRVIQVQQGYITERQPNNTFKTIYYLADENGYRITKSEIDSKPTCTYCQDLS